MSIPPRLLVSSLRLAILPALKLTSEERSEVLAELAPECRGDSVDHIRLHVRSFLEALSHDDPQQAAHDADVMAHDADVIVRLLLSILWGEP